MKRIMTAMLIGVLVLSCISAFIQTDGDGSGESQESNKANYFGNNPVHRVDPASILCQDIDASGHIVSVCVNGGPIQYGKPNFKTPNSAGARPIGESHPGTLRFWEARGAHFSGEGWNNERIQSQLTALERSAGAINSYEQTRQDWRLDSTDGLIFQGSYDNSDCHASEGVTRKSCYFASTNTIILLWNVLSNPGYSDPYLDMTAAAIHELGHVVDYHAGFSDHGDFSSKFDWATSVPGWAKVDGAWEYTGSPEGMVSSYARTTPIEDFAETWTWWVDAQNQSPLYAWNVWEDAPNQAKFSALDLAIYHPDN